MNSITCPNCGEKVEISLALKLQIEEEIVSRESAKHKKELIEAKKSAEEQAIKNAKEKMDLLLKDKESQAKEASVKSKKLQDDLLEQSRMIRGLKEKDEQRSFEMEKKLQREEGKIRLDAEKKAQERERSKILEKDKQLQDALRANEEMRRKLQQGSQQTQGEAFELEFEKTLRKHYPNDKVLEVKKGVKGGDIVQEVWDGNGNYVGKILWELKNTKTWSELWIDKLKNDRRMEKTEEAVLISEVLPSDMKIAGFRNSVWVTQQNFVIPLTDTLRAKLIQLYYIKNSVQGKDQKMEILYKYFSGTEFKHRIEAIIDSFTGMQAEIEKEKRYFSNKWARDEKNIRQVIDNTYGMHGDLKGIIGQMLPQIKGIEVLEIESEVKNS